MGYHSLVLAMVDGVKRGDKAKAYESGSVPNDSPGDNDPILTSIVAVEWHRDLECCKRSE